jgi:hypothetical protein
MIASAVASANASSTKVTAVEIAQLERRHTFLTTFALAWGSGSLCSHAMSVFGRRSSDSRSTSG